MFEGELVVGKSTEASEKQNRRHESVSSVAFFSASKQLGIVTSLGGIFSHANLLSKRELLDKDSSPPESNH